MSIEKPEKENKQKVVALFPGIGYTCEKPLLYYSWKLALECGYQVIPVPYSGFPRNVKGDPEKMQECFVSALAQTKELLKETDWGSFEEIVFIGKSIGTAVAARYAMEYGLHVRQVFLTPVNQTFSFPSEEGIVFHGTSDPWADTEFIKTACEMKKMPLYLTENANHSLETGILKSDLKTLKKTMKRIRMFLEKTVQS